MIEITKICYKTDDGQIFDTFSDAQLHELEVLFEKISIKLPKETAIAILQNKTTIIDILSKNKSNISFQGPSIPLAPEVVKECNKTIITDAITSIIGKLNKK
ncbi:MAG TPA: hypothetical protein PLC59_00035 [Bacteroidales bacterium]|jgi:hypothetical protein|nr:hypothetical protein [Bacteroidales bacterium]